MRRIAILISLLWCTAMPVQAQVSVGINIGVNMPVYPQLVLVPGYPVYYYPNAESNYFFYDGQYWVYQDDNWYASDWYDGPWDLVEPEFVPVYVLRVPVQYYPRPPVYFRAWRPNAPPHWGERWGRDWESRRAGWDHWDRREVPRPAPLPIYQRQFSGNRYPHSIEQQRTIHTQNYHYQPQDPLVKRSEQRFDNARERRDDVRPNVSPPPATRNADHDVHDRAPPAAQRLPSNATPPNVPNRQMPPRNDANQHPNPAPRAIETQPKRDPPNSPRPSSPPAYSQPSPRVDHDADRHDAPREMQPNRPQPERQGPDRPPDAGREHKDKDDRH